MQKTCTFLFRVVWSIVVIILNRLYDALFLKDAELKMPTALNSLPYIVLLLTRKSIQIHMKLRTRMRDCFVDSVMASCQSNSKHINISEGLLSLMIPSSDFSKFASTIAHFPVQREKCATFYGVIML